MNGMSDIRIIQPATAQQLVKANTNPAPSSTSTITTIAVIAIAAWFLLK